MAVRGPLAAEVAAVARVLRAQGWDDVQTHSKLSAVTVRVAAGASSRALAVWLSRTGETWTLACHDVVPLQVVAAGEATDAGIALGVHLARRFGLPAGSDAVGGEPWRAGWARLPEPARRLLECVACAPAAFAREPGCFELPVVALAGDVPARQARDLAAMWVDAALARCADDDMLRFDPLVLAYGAIRAVADGVNAQAVAERLLEWQARELNPGDQRD